MPQILPLTPSVARYQFATVLAGIPCVIDARWNSRDNAWYLDIADTEETPIINGMKVVLGVHLGRRAVHDLFTKGVFVAADLTGDGIDATYDDFGQRVEIRYYTNFEMMAELKDQGVG